MFCYKCGKKIDKEDSFCRYCGANLKNKNNASEITENVNLNVSFNKKNDRVIDAINYAYKEGALGFKIPKDMIEYVVNNNKSNNYSIAQTIYQIVNSWKKGMLGFKIPKDMIWDVVRK